MAAAERARAAQERLAELRADLAVTERHADDAQSAVGRAVTRASEARSRAAIAHARAAERHDQAAALFTQVGDLERATEQLGGAAIERRAETETRAGLNPARTSPRDVVEPLGENAGDTAGS